MNGTVAPWASNVTTARTPASGRESSWANWGTGSNAAAEVVMRAPTTAKGVRVSSGESPATTCYRNGVVPTKHGQRDPGPQGPKDGGLDAAGDDVVLRAITNDGAFRVMVARTTCMVREAIERQAAVGESARAFGDLLTATVLFRETMAPQLRVQGVLRGAGGSGTLVADSQAGGSTRGLVQLRPGKPQIDVGEGS